MKNAPPQVLNSESVLRGIFDGSIKGVVWNKLIRRSLYNKYRIEFPSDIIVLEDVYANAQLLLHPLKISYVSKPLYHYDRTANPHSITMDKHPKWNITADGIVTHFRELLENTDYWGIWVEKELPWIAYLCLYYNSFSANKFHREFHYLYDQRVKNLNPWVKFALKHYVITSLLMKVRRNVSLLVHR